MLFGISFFNRQIWNITMNNERHNNERNNQKHSFFQVITNASKNLQSLQSQNKFKSLDCLSLR